MCAVKIGPDSSGYYDALAPVYGQIFSTKMQFHSAIDDRIRQNSDFSRWLNVLDVGSGDGKRIIDLFQNSDCTLHSVENSVVMANILRAQPRISKVIQADFSLLEYDDFKVNYDLVLMQWNVLGHISNVPNAFKLAYKLVGKGGHFVFDFNNPLNIKHYGFRNVFINFLKMNFSPSKRFLKFKIDHDGAETETHFYKVSYIVKLLEQSGFRIAEIKYFDYASGEIQGPYKGQIYVDAIKD